jgi:hypothetical protein
VLVELCCRTHAIIVCWLYSCRFDNYDIVTFKNVFLREPHVWLNFLAAIGIAIKYPDNYEDIIYAHLINTTGKIVRSAKTMYYTELISKASIMSVKVKDYARDNELYICTNLREMDVSVYQHLKFVSEGTLGSTKKFRHAQVRKA